MRVGIFTDSRGDGIGPIIHEHEDMHEVYVYPNPGCTFESIVPTIRAYHTRVHFEAVYIMIGNNNLTVLNRATRKIHIEEETPHELYKSYNISFIPFQVELSHILRGTPVTIMPVTPIAINTYNKEPNPYIKQWVLDMGIVMINEEIVYQNAWNGLSTPLLQEVICRSEGAGGHRTYYNRLVDGLHPTYPTLRKWARKIRRSIQLNDHHLQ